MTQAGPLRGLLDTMLADPAVARVLRSTDRPRLVLEGPAAARPVIATYIAGTPELVQDGKTGWMVPAGDTQALANAMDRFANVETGYLLRMGTAARERVLARHDVNVEAAKLAGFISE